MTNTLIDLLYPRRCPVCDRVLYYGERGVCQSCRMMGLPERLFEPLCRMCGKRISDVRREFCGDCERQAHSFRQGCAVFAYRGMEDAMRRMKDGGRREYADFFAEEMEKILREKRKIWRPDVLVPIPIHKRKRMLRGFNQAELLTKRLSKRLYLPEDRKNLMKVRETPDQKGLDRAERRENLKCAFEVKEEKAFIGKRILLVDDVYTTGTTIDAAAGKLMQSGAEAVFFLTVCIGKGY